MSRFLALTQGCEGKAWRPVWVLTLVRGGGDGGGLGRAREVRRAALGERRGLSAKPLTAVREGGGPGGFEAPLQPSRLAEAQPQRLGQLPRGDPSGTGGFQQPGPMHLFPAHREGLHRRRTFSRSSYPRTVSCSSGRSLNAPEV